MNIDILINQIFKCSQPFNLAPVRRTFYQVAKSRLPCRHHLCFFFQSFFGCFSFCSHMQNLGLHIEENAESIEFGFKTTDIPNFDNIKLFHQNMFLNEPIKKNKNEKRSIVHTNSSI